jgi:uncharacterized membrane protein
MNRALYIILVPAVLVAAGYVIVLRLMGFSPGYLRLALAVGLIAGVLWWLGRKSTRRTPSLRQ